MYKMWYFVFLSVLFAESMAMSDQDVKMHFSQTVLGCHSSFPVPMSELTNLQKLIVPTETQTKCLLRCAYKTLGTMGDDNRFDIEGSYKNAEKVAEGDETRLENGKKLADVCVSEANNAVEDDDPNCERAGAMFSCLLRESENYGFNIK